MDNRKHKAMREAQRKLEQDETRLTKVQKVKDHCQGEERGPK